MDGCRNKADALIEHEAEPGPREPEAEGITEQPARARAHDSDADERDDGDEKGVPRPAQAAGIDDLRNLEEGDDAHDAHDDDPHVEDGRLIGEERIDPPAPKQEDEADDRRAGQAERLVGPADPPPAGGR